MNRNDTQKIIVWKPLKEVQNELSKKDKEFWMKFHELTGNFFIEATDDEMNNFEMLKEFKVYDEDWSYGESSAAPILICVSIHNNYTIITQENQRSEMRIPFVCKRLGINCLNLNQFFENQE
jgi:hypothetical protein